MSVNHVLDQEAHEMGDDVPDSSDEWTEADIRDFTEFSLDHAIAGGDADT
jgi:acyl dehydratase